MLLKKLAYRRHFILKSDRSKKHPQVWRRMNKTPLSDCEDIWCQDFIECDGEWMSANTEVIPVQATIKKLRS